MQNYSRKPAVEQVPINARTSFSRSDELTRFSGESTAFGRRLRFRSTLYAIRITVFRLCGLSVSV